MEKKKNILICPLEWGLGHSGRMVPVARLLMQKGNNVIIGAGTKHRAFFMEEFPGITCIDFPGFRLRYSRWLPQYLVIILMIPAFIVSTLAEHYRLKRIIRDNRIDIIISDSRPGLWNKSITSVFITHMMRIPFPEWMRFLDRTGIRLVKRIIRKFNFCLIPDMPGDVNISGDLSHNIDLQLNTRFIGLLSRFVNQSAGQLREAGKYNCLVILSGPEPQKSLLRKILEKNLRHGEKPSVFLLGEPGSGSLHHATGNIVCIGHVTTAGMAVLISQSDHIITRSGYTTVMELLSINRSAVLIPAPGQTEQEYLAGYLSGKNWFTAVRQQHLDKILPGSKNTAGFPPELVKESEDLLIKAIDELLEYQHQ